VLVSLPRNLDQSRCRIEQLHIVPTLGQPERIRAGRSTDVENYGWWLWCMTKNQLASPKLLELKRTEPQA
jgi:hypothetical protein